MSSLKMEKVVPLTRTSVDVGRRSSAVSRLMPLHIEHPFLPELSESAALECLHAVEACLRQLGVSYSQHQQQQHRQLRRRDDTQYAARPVSDDFGKRQGVRLRHFSFEGSMLLSGSGLFVGCFHSHRTFSVQVSASLLS